MDFGGGDGLMESGMRALDMSNSGNENGLPIKTEVRQRPAPAKAPPKLLPPYNVVLLNDDDHTYDYVIEMLSSVFGYNLTKTLSQNYESRLSFRYHNSAESSSMNPR